VVEAKVLKVLLQEEIQVLMPLAAAAAAVLGMDL